MFEKIILRRSEGGGNVTVGELAEALLFYQNVHIILDYTSLSYLVDSIGVLNFLSLLDRPNLTAVYCDENLATRTDRQGAMEYHSFVAFTLTSSVTGEDFPTPLKRIEFIFKQKGCSARNASKLAERFLNKVPVKKLESNYFLQGGIVKAATSDLLDSTFSKDAIRQVLSVTTGVRSQDFSALEFEVIPSEDGVLIFTNIDFHEINSNRRALNSSLDIVSVASFLNEILWARADISMSSHYGGDYYTFEATSKIVRLRYDELLKRIGIHSEELRKFREVSLPNSPTLKEVINKGERSFDEFLQLLDKSEKFRNWAKNVNPDANIIQAYFKDVSSESWINKLPGKTLRYVIGSAVGMVASPLAGFGLSAADTFLVEKLAGGWRPSHFVERELKPFLSPN